MSLLDDIDDARREIEARVKRLYPSAVARLNLSNGDPAGTPLDEGTADLLYDRLYAAVPARPFTLASVAAEDRWIIDTAVFGYSEASLWVETRDGDVDDVIRLNAARAEGNS